MIANDVSKTDFGFNKDLNEVIIIDKNGKTEKISKSSKKFIASVIAKKIVKTFLSNEKVLTKSDIKKYYKQFMLKKIGISGQKNFR